MIYKNKCIIQILSLCFLVLLLSSCKPYSIVERGSLIESAEINVTPRIEWNRSSSNKNNESLWTIDGEYLNLLIFSNAQEGEYIFPIKNRWGLTSKESPKFKKGMNILEIPDFLKFSFEKHGYEKFNISSVEPSKFLNSNGFKMIFATSTKDGLDKAGLAYGTIINKKLYLMVYVAALIKFYSTGAEDFVQMAEAARL